MKRPTRHAVFWAGLLLLMAAFGISLVMAYRQQASAPMTIMLTFPDNPKGNWRNIQIELKSQHPRDPLFSGEIFMGLEDTEVGDGQLVLSREAVGTFARSEIRLNLFRDEIFRTHTNVAAMDFPVNDLGHSRFPFDSSYVDLNLSLKPAIPIEAIRITNRVPGFVLSQSSAVVDRHADGSLRLRFQLRRNLFTQVLCWLILFAGLCFATLILATQTASALGSSVAAFFFSLWSLRGILATQIQTFPTLLDYAIVLLCSFMLLGLIWRVLTHPELMGKQSP